MLKGAFSFNNWCESDTSPQFYFCDLVLSVKLVTFSLIRAFREADLTLYC